MLCIFIVLFLICSSVAQNFGAEPSCAIPCLTSAISAAGCALTDEACQCGTGQAAIQTAVTPCLLTACDAADLGVAASVGFALCSSYSANAAVATTSKTSSAIASSTKSANAISSSPSTASSTTSSQSSTSIISSPITSSASTLHMSTTISDNSLSGITSSGSGSISSSSQQTMTSSSASSSSSSKGLSAGTSAGIGVGAALGSLLFISFTVLAFWYGRRSATRKPNTDNSGDVTGKSELGADNYKLDEPLTDLEKDELERRRRASELQGRGVMPAEIAGNERFELEARRKVAREVNEIG